MTFLTVSSPCSLNLMSPDWSRPGVLQQGLQEVEGLPREVLVDRETVDLLGGLPPSVVGGGGGGDCLRGCVFPLQPEDQRSDVFGVEPGDDRLRSVVALGRQVCAVSSMLLQ
jgi:hypothetical protein